MTTINLPDMEEVMNNVEELGRLALEEAQLQTRIKAEEARVTIEATTNKKYWNNGKPPSQSFIDSCYKITGFDSEILTLRDKLDQISSALYYRKLKMDVYKQIMDVWRSQQATERLTVL